LKQAAQGHGGVSISGGVQKIDRYCTLGHSSARHGGVGLAVGLDGLRSLFQP